jgi:hypothetical protein
VRGDSGNEHGVCKGCACKRILCWHERPRGRDWPVV